MNREHWTAAIVDFGNRSRRIMGEHIEGCPVHRQAAKHAAAVDRVLALAAEGRMPSSTRRQTVGRAGDLLLSPAGDGERQLDMAIREAQALYPIQQTDGFGLPVWTYCRCRPAGYDPLVGAAE